jgi:predicted GH43/DUF377 family glycosyl hydrolase
MVWDYKIFPASVLLPQSWSGCSDFRVFNPSLIRRADGFILSYRVVGESVGRKIACVALDAGLDIIPGTVTVLSDLIEFSDEATYSNHTRSWFADARLFALAEGTFVTWNDGIPADEANHQFRIQLDPDTLHPIGRAQEIRLEAGQNRVEKNWMLFEGGGTKVVYSICPLRVMSPVSAAADSLVFGNFATSYWNFLPYLFQYGQLRGGAQPVLRNGYFYNFCHSSYNTPDGNRYVAGVVKFECQAPFRMVSAIREPLELPNPFGTKTQKCKLNPRVSSVVFPCGAVIDGDDWIVTYGLNDEHSLACRIPHSLIESLLDPVSRRGPLWDAVCRARNKLAHRTGRPLPLLTWLLGGL